MRKFHSISFFALNLLLGVTTARGVDYKIDLELSDGKQHQEAANRAGGSHQPLNKRAVIAGAANSKFLATWKITRTSAAEAKDVLIHFYVVKMDRRGQAPPALDPKRVVIESALTMDFPEGENAVGSPHFRVERPGIYLVRVEAAPDPQAAGADPHASANMAEYAELELVAK